KPIAVGSRERAPSLPKVPTVIEGGVADYEAVSWIGMLAPAATHRDIVDRLAADAASAIRLRDVAGVLERNGWDVVGGTPTEFRHVIEADYAKYEKLAGLFKQQKP